jgi:hypothetical protein
MKRILTLLVCALVVWNVSAQIAQTFTPESGKAYYIKSQDGSKGRNTSFLVEDAETGLLSIAPLTSAQVATTTTAQWYITYTTDKGYLLQNVSTGHYMKYTGIYGSTVTAEYRAQDMIKAIAKESGDDETPYLFAATPNKNGTASIGFSSNAFKIQGYCLTLPETTGTQGLDAYSDTHIGTWDIDYGKANQTWWFMDNAQLAQMENSLNALNFNMPSGQTFYIKNQTVARGRDDSFVIDNGDTIAIKVMSIAEAKANNNVKWQSDYVAGKGYTIKNVGTGKYLRYKGEYGSTDAAKYRGANFIVPAAWDDAEAQRYYFDMPIPSGFGVYNFGVYNETPFFEIQGYAISCVGTEPLQRWDAYSKVRIGSYDSNGNEYQVWWFMTEDKLAQYEAAHAATPFVWEEDAIYTISPYNYWISKPASMTEITDEQFITEYRNCNLAADWGTPLLKKADNTDEAQQWLLMPSNDEGTAFLFQNVEDANGFLTIKKWEKPASDTSDGFEIAKQNTTVSEYDSESTAQMLQIDFSEYGKDENGKTVKVFGICNNNDVPELTQHGNMKFYLDMWNDGKSYAGMQMGSYRNWNVLPGAAQKWLIRNIAEGSSVKTVKKEAVATVYTSGKNIVVQTPVDGIISVYSVTSSLVAKTIEKNIPMATPGMYIVKVGTEAFKVFVK